MYLSKCSHSVCIVMVLELTVHLDNTDLLCRQSIVPARKLPFLVPLNHASGIECSTIYHRPMPTRKKSWEQKVIGTDSTRTWWGKGLIFQSHTVLTMLRNWGTYWRLQRFSSRRIQKTLSSQKTRHLQYVVCVSWLLQVFCTPPASFFFLATNLKLVCWASTVMNWQHEWESHSVSSAKTKEIQPCMYALTQWFSNGAPRTPGGPR